MGPGETALTRTPSGPHSIARHLVSMLTPALAAQTWDWATQGFTPCGAVMLIREAPGRFRCSKDARRTLNVPKRSISTTALNPRADMFRAGATKLPAAPDTTTS